MTAPVVIVLVVLAAARQWGWLSLAVLAAVAGQAVACWLWPLTRCRACQGSRRNRGSNSRRWGRCRRCGGTGERVRIGARLVNRAMKSTRSR